MVLHYIGIAWNSSTYSSKVYLASTSSTSNAQITISPKTLGVNVAGITYIKYN